MGAMKEKLKTLSLTTKKKKFVPITTLSEITYLLDQDKLSSPTEDKLKIIKERKITKIKKIRINKFRGLENIEIDIADNITLICGKNGTNKSTLLGIIAQCFSFSTDYRKIIAYKTSEKNTSNAVYAKLPYRTIAGKHFISYATEHFRLSEKYDLTGTMDINIEIYDAINFVYLDKLQLRLTREKNKRGEYIPRSRLRNNQDTDRAVTHPVIYLGLKRLFPISERKYEEVENDQFIKDNLKDFISDNNFILMKKSSNITTTVGIVNSMVAYENNYDHQSVSVGEDNLGQILQAIYSFKKLKIEMGDSYRGGILLIDEVDSSLFCAAQIRLMRKLEQYSKELKIQIILTSHSLDIMETINNSHKKNPQGFKLYYLTNSRGKIETLSDIKQIRNDIKDSFPEENKEKKVNIYTEDQEARDFLLKLLDNNKLLQKINLIDVNLGFSQYKKLIEFTIPEFSTNSVIIFDGDQSDDNFVKEHTNIVCLPSNLSPEQLLFEFLCNMDEKDNFWAEAKISRAAFITLSRTMNIIESLKIDISSHVELQASILSYRERQSDDKQTLRKLFKQWYLSEQIQYLINQYNLYEYWIAENQIAKNVFISQLNQSIDVVLKNLP